MFFKNISEMIDGPVADQSKRVYGIDVKFSL